MKTPAPDQRLGVWLFGALGGLATTLVVGARAIARGKAGTQGMLTATPLLDGVPLAAVASMVFGGHEVRRGDWASSAAEIQQANGT
ncbi:MAG TPA: myo-inositol-1-phosphate synthase, partial [Planctomycetota bacterium]|nr:myo-inositol-1-phosphate synthase [Planctomycetota bacterium]